MGNEFRPYYTVNDAIAYFRGQGYRVEQRDVVRYAGNESWPTKEWKVQSQTTGEWLDVNACYREARAMGDDKAWQSNVSKIDLINILNGKKK